MNILYFILTIAIVIVSLGIGFIILKFIGMHYSNKYINDIAYHKDEVKDEVIDDKDNI